MKMKYLFSVCLVCSALIGNLYAENMKEVFRKEVQVGLARSKRVTDVLMLADLQRMPPIVRQYLRYTRSLDKPIVENFKVDFSGRIRGENKENAWMTFRAEQYSFMDAQTRLFYITARKMGLPATGLHCYKNGEAYMNIKLCGLFSLADAKGDTISRSETVTLLNDMCCLAPATLISDEIMWESISETSVRAIFTHGKYRVSAVLTFDLKGRLLNFVSNDRYEIKGKTARLYPWATPILEYKEMNGYFLPSRARAEYRHPEGWFCYGEFTIENIRYNMLPK